MMGADVGRLPYEVVDNLFDHPLTPKGLAALRTPAARRAEANPQTMPDLPRARRSTLSHGWSRGWPEPPPVAPRGASGFNGTTSCRPSYDWDRESARLEADCGRKILARRGR